MDKLIRPVKTENNNKYMPKSQPSVEKHQYQNRQNFTQNDFRLNPKDHGEYNQNFKNQISNKSSNSYTPKLYSQFAGMNISKHSHYNSESFEHGNKNNTLKNQENVNVKDIKSEPYVSTSSDDKFNDDLIGNVYKDLTNSYIYFGIILSLNDKYGFIKAYKDENTVVEAPKSKWSNGNKSTQPKKDNLYFQRNSVIGYVKELFVGDIVSYTITSDASPYSNQNIDEDGSANGYKKAYSSAHFCKKAENVALLGDICIERSIFPLLGNIIKLIDETSNKAILEYEVKGETEQLTFDYQGLSHIQKMEELKVGDKVFFNIVAYPFPGALRTAYNVRQALEDSNKVRTPTTLKLHRGYITSSKESFGKITYVDERFQETPTKLEVFFHFEDAYIEATLLRNPKFRKETYFKQHLTAGTPVFFKLENKFGKEIATQVTPLGTGAPIEARIFTPYLSYTKPPSSPYDNHLGSVYIEHLGMEVVMYKDSLRKTPPSSLFHGDTVQVTLERLSPEPEAKGDKSSNIDSDTPNSDIDFACWSVNVSSVQLCAQASFRDSQEPRCKAYTLRNFGCRDVIVTIDQGSDNQRFYVAPLKNGEIIETSSPEQSLTSEGAVIETFEVTLGRSCSDTVPFPTYLGAVSFFTATRALQSGAFPAPKRSPAERRLLQIGYVVCYGDGQKSLAGPGSSIYSFLMEQPGQGLGIFYASLEELFEGTEYGPDQIDHVIELYNQLIASRLVNQVDSHHSRHDQSRGLAPFSSELKAVKRREATLKVSLSEIVSRALLELWRQKTSWRQKSPGRPDIKTTFLPYSSYRIQNFSTGNFILFNLLDENPIAANCTLPMIQDPISCQTTYKGYIIRSSKGGKRHHYAPNNKEPDLVQTEDNCYTLPITNYFNTHTTMNQSCHEINLGDAVSFRIDAPNSFTTTATAHTVALDGEARVDDGQSGTLKYFGVVVSVNSSANKYKVPFAGLIRILAAQGQLVPEHESSQAEIAFYFKDSVPHYKSFRGGEMVAFDEKFDICHQNPRDNSLAVMADASTQNGKKIGQKAVAVRAIEAEVGEYCFEGKITQMNENGTELTIAPTIPTPDISAYFCYKDRGGSTNQGRHYLKPGDAVYCWRAGPDPKSAIYHVERRIIQGASKWASDKSGPISQAQGPAKYQGSSYEPAPTGQKPHFFNSNAPGPPGSSRFRNHSATVANNNCDESTSLTGLVPEAFNVKLIRQPRQPMPDERGFSAHGHLRNIPLAPCTR